MKKTIKGFVLGVIITTMLMSTAIGAKVKDTIEVVYNSVNITVNGKKVNADNILYEGTTYVPLRAVSEILGKEVSWSGSTNTASINDKNQVNSLDKNDLSKIKLYGRILNHYIELRDYGNILLSTDNDISLGLNGIIYSDDPQYMEIAANYFDETVQWYNDLLEPTRAIILEAKLQGIDVSDMNVILNNYSGAIEKYYVSIDLVYNYYKYNDQSAFNKNFDVRSDANSLIRDGTKKAYNKYFDFVSKIQLL